MLTCLVTCRFGLAVVKVVLSCLATCRFLGWQSFNRVELFGDVPFWVASRLVVLSCLATCRFGLAVVKVVLDTSRFDQNTDQL